MKKKVTAVFDIGKTNKKFFLFDENFREIDRQYVKFNETVDEDGFESENLEALTDWMLKVFDQATERTDIEIRNLNFSTYGASLVHLGEDNKPVTAFYNYLKPIPDSITELFLDKYPNQERFELDTASPMMGLLNSGLQLFYLKYEKPEVFKKIRKTLHFPQYLSFLFSGRLASDYTSIGCHTGLWNHSDGRYADWVTAEGFDQLLPKIVPSDQSHSIQYKRQTLNVGVGVHDSSSALVPYINGSDDPFVLISTGTWSICMNFFNEDPLSPEELRADCLNFLSLKGSSIKASRLFLGKHLSDKAHLLCDYFKVPYQSFKTVPWQPNYKDKRTTKKKLLFNHELIAPERFGFENNSRPDYSIFSSYEEALMQLMDELTDLQIESMKLSLGTSDIKKVYLDGGFSSSEIFVQFLANKLPEYELYSTSFSLGTALGAALLVSYRTLPADFLTKTYNIKRHLPYQRVEV